ncbi:response regulator transcription factor [Marinomonas posidonica]|uniref:Transcriptional regulator, LuxR family n=1 Tax=Marinomonas posidonica (strain CECT 7376 / NCIMB 14433 / IVIA-Po-181) TaxID=491952 RepID=F6CVZ4_MARPP|nr:response regulator transcription factor [Marinomonas posidonica]AEF54293.1 transcriptional regulator, LuxR family [Marinomonas posidonica IVIA-Po-181]
MKILCWNTDDAVWAHWLKIVPAIAELVRVDSLEASRRALIESQQTFQYCFVYLADETFSSQVEEVVALKSEFLDHNMVVFPNQASQQAALRLFSIGVNGQCAPYIGEEQLSLVLSVIDSGEIWGGKAFIQQLISQSAEQINQPSVQMDGLSEREMDVARYIAEGLSNKQVATQMAITERTVKAHLTSIFKKTETRDRLALALKAKSHFLVQ